MNQRYHLCMTILIFLVGCHDDYLNWSSFDEDPIINREYLGTKTQQLESLSYIFYANTPLPPKPTKEELDRLKSRLQDTTSDELAILKKIYKNRRELLVYSLRDLDGDGVNDYMICPYSGKFTEGDIDIDNDGVLNVNDAAPYDPSIQFFDSDQDAIGDHIDWSEAQTSISHPLLAELQETIYHNYGILLVNRNATFNFSFVAAINDALAVIFRNTFKRVRRIPTLRVIAAESAVFLGSKTDGTYANNESNNQTLVIFQDGINLSPVSQLGLLAHEIAHSYQFQLDFDENNLGQENKRFFFQPDHLFSILSPYGIKFPFDPTKAKEEPRQSLFLFYYSYPYGFPINDKRSKQNIF